jgi:hypothetical protein
MADHWADDVRLSDIEPRLICSACVKRGADVRPDFTWNRRLAAVMGYRYVGDDLGLLSVDVRRRKTATRDMAQLSSSTTSTSR